MKKYAIIKLQGKQFRVQPDEQFIVDRVNYDEGQKFTVEEVLLVKDSDQVKIGQPYVKDAQVELEVIKHQRSKKLRVAKYKAKSRYRRVKGHRQHQTVLKVNQV